MSCNLKEGKREGERYPPQHSLAMSTKKLKSPYRAKKQQLSDFIRLEIAQAESLKEILRVMQTVTSENVEIFNALKGLFPHLCLVSCNCSIMWDNTVWSPKIDLVPIYLSLTKYYRSNYFLFGKLRLSFSKWRYIDVQKRFKLPFFLASWEPQRCLVPKVLHKIGYLHSKLLIDWICSLLQTSLSRHMRLPVAVMGPSIKARNKTKFVHTNGIVISRSLLSSPSSISSPHPPP